MARYLICIVVLGVVAPVFAMEPPHPRDICRITARVDALKDRPSVDDAMQSVTDHEVEVTVLSSVLAEHAQGTPGNRCAENRVGKKDYFKLCADSLPLQIRLKVGDKISALEGKAQGGGRYCLTDVRIE